MYLMGYMTAQSRIYMMDKDYTIVSYTLLLTVIEYKTLVIRGEFEAAAEVLKNIPEEKMNEIAKFLESREMLPEALEVATDVDYRFDLALQLQRLDTAIEIAEEVDSEIKWTQLGELAMTKGKFKLCEKCLMRGKDLSGLLLLYASQSRRKAMEQLAIMAKQTGKLNIAFVCCFLRGDVDACIDTLIESERYPEAAFFARTYTPSRISDVVGLWKNDVKKINPKAADALADPGEYPNLFPDLELALKAEGLARQRMDHPPPASAYQTMEGSNTVDVMQQMQSVTGVEENGDVEHQQQGQQEPQEPQESVLTTESTSEVFVDAVGDVPLNPDVDDADLDDWGLEDE